MVKLAKYLITLSVIVTLAGCQFGPVKKRGDKTGEDQAQQTQQDQEQTQSGQTDEAEKFASGGVLDIKSLNDPNSPLSQRVLYFELDSSQVSEEDRQIISTHAQFLSANPNVTIVLEGHADERGTREYNVALGEKRAKAVKQLMTLQGVTEQQIQLISFGEERPVAIGHDESAWRLNRRVEILYSGY